MALPEGQEYSSPSKRIKLDLSDHLSNSNVELDIGTFSASKNNVFAVPEGKILAMCSVYCLSFSCQRWRFLGPICSLPRRLHFVGVTAMTDFTAVNIPNRWHNILSCMRS